MQRVGKVKGFSPASYEGLDNKIGFCLNGNSNGIDFLLYDLESTVIGQCRDADTSWKKLHSASNRTKGILRAEVRITKSKALRDCTNADNAPSQIVVLAKNRQRIFLDTFARIVPFGNFYKKGTATEIIRNEIKDTIMRRRMLRLLALIPEKNRCTLLRKL